jgi:hypothetical protein
MTVWEMIGLVLLTWFFLFAVAASAFNIINSVDGKKITLKINFKK